MVEFAVVLMAKQRMDWNEKSEGKNNKVFSVRSRNSGIDLKIDASKTDVTSEKQNTVQITDHILDNCKLTKDMPPYRKMDVLSFVLFTGLYFCFNFVYFIICTKY